jgi:hypothetical protein
MATVLEEYAANQQLSVVRILWGGELNVKDIHKGIFLASGEHCLSCKGVHCWAKKCDKYFANDEEVETEMRKWLRQQSQVFFLCCEFRRTGKAMGQVYQCWWRICQEINIFPGLNIISFTFYIHP